MGILDSLFKSTRLSRSAAELSKEPKYMEVEWGKGGAGSRNYVRVVTLNDSADVETVLDFLRSRKNIVILRVKPRLIQEKMELKRALNRIKRTTSAIGGDIVGVKEDVIVITPPEVEISRGVSVAETSQTTPTELAELETV